MCLSNRTETYIPVLEAYKVFHHKGRKLYSAFCSAVVKGANLEYCSGEVTIAHIPGSRFFAFEKFKDAALIVEQGSAYWNFVSPHLVVLPVTLLEVDHEGSVVIDSTDPQCLFTRAHAYESQRIIVHGEEKNWNNYYRYVIQRIQRGYMSPDRVVSRNSLEYLTEAARPL